MANTKTLANLIKAVTADQTATKIAEITNAFEARKAHEALTASANSSIQDKLVAYHKKMALPGIATLLVAIDVSPSFINRELTAGKRFNVYAIDKTNDLLHGLNSGHFKNAINQAVLKSMFAFEKAKIAFDGQAALAAASDKVATKKELVPFLTRHTVDAGTAPTQSSSTMNALMAIGAVKNTGSAKFPIWVLTGEPVTEKLREAFAA